MVDDRDELGLATSVGADQLGEVTVGHVEGRDRLFPYKQVDPDTGSSNGPTNVAVSGWLGAQDQGQIPHSIKMLHHLAIDSATAWLA